MERLKHRTDFRAAAKAAARGAKAPAGAFILQARAREDAGAIRVGFTVSRQVGNAVERNRVRRRLREVVRLAPVAGFRQGHDYVLIGRRAALATPFGDMVRQFDAALSRIHAVAAAGRERAPAATAATGGGSDASPHRAGSPVKRARQAAPQNGPEMDRRPPQRASRNEHDTSR